MRRFVVTYLIAGPLALGAAHGQTPPSAAPDGGAASAEKAPPYFPGRMKQALLPRDATGARPPRFPLGLYDENADGQSEINAACEQAAREGKRVVAVFGENYCHFCSWLHDTIVDDPRLKELFDREFVTAWIDLGQQFSNKKHMDLAAANGADIRQTGAPVMVVIDPKTCRPTRVLPSKDVLAQPMALSRVFDEGAMLRWFTMNTAPAPTAESLVAAGNQRAATEKKRVLIYFKSETDPRAVAFDRVVNSADAGAILSKDLVPVALDLDRTPGARGQLELFSGSTTTSLPWFLITEPGGRMIVDADSRPLGRSVALPASDEEAEALTTKMKRALRSITDEEWATVLAALRKPPPPLGSPAPGGPAK